MNLVAVVWLVVGVCTLLVLAIFLVTFVRQVQRLSSSVVQFQQEITPVLESIQRDAQVAQEHSERLQNEADTLRAIGPAERRTRSGARPRG